MREAERLANVRKLWMERPREKQTETDVLVFYGWLKQNQPELLKHGGNTDDYQQLQSDLSGYTVK
jgi:hypothetical protein